MSAERSFLTMLLVVIAVATSLLYRNVNRDWIRFRDAETLFAQARYPEALAAYRTVARGPGRDLVLLAHLAEAAVHCGGTDEAVAAYETLVSLAPESAPYLSALAGLYASKGRYKDSIEMIRKALRRSPSDRRLYLMLARMLTASNQLEDAIREYSKLIGEDS